MLRLTIIILTIIIIILVYTFKKDNIVIVYDTEEFIRELQTDEKKTLKIVNGIYLTDSISVPSNITIDCTHPNCILDGVSGTTIEIFGAIKSR